MPAPSWRRSCCSARADPVAVSRRLAIGWLGGGLALASRARPGTGDEPHYTLRGQLTQGGWAVGRARPFATVWLDDVPVPVAADGAFLLGFDRDAPAVVQLTVSDGRERPAPAPLAIAPRAWRIEQVDAPFRPPGVPDAEFQRRRADELARIAAARALVTGAQGWRQTMIRPAPGRVSGLFGAQRVYRGQPGSYHSGLDLAAPAGTPILAPADGVVILAAETPFTLEGRLLMLDHGMGLTSAFLHCSAHAVQVGHTVKQGDPVASVGMTGRATGPHLHWGLRWRTARLDPLLFLQA